MFEKKFHLELKPPLAARAIDNVWNVLEQRAHTLFLCVRKVFLVVGKVSGTLQVVASIVEPLHTADVKGGKIMSPFL